MNCNNRLTQLKETPEAPTLAKDNLKKMGPMSKGELITLATISGAVVLWMFGEALGVPAVLAAMLALATLLCTGAVGRHGIIIRWSCLQPSLCAGFLPRCNVPLGSEALHHKPQL